MGEFATGGSTERPEQSRFERRPGPNADPLTRRDEALAFVSGPEGGWRPPEWFDRVAVVLFETTDVVNIGGVARSMANAGFSRLRLVNPAPFDPWDVIGIAHYTQHIVDSMGVYGSLVEALADAHFVAGFSGKHHRAHPNTLRLGDAVPDLARRAQMGETVAILLGREDTGLPTEALDHCHTIVHIPTNPAFPSLNLAQASLLTLYGLFEYAEGTQQTVRPPQRTAPPATSALLEDLFADLERALDAVEFLKHRSPHSTMRTLRSVLYRANVDTREASLLRAACIEVRRYLHKQGVLPSLGPIGARPEGSAPPDDSGGAAQD